MRCAPSRNREMSSWGFCSSCGFLFSYCYCYGRSFMHSSSGTTKNPFTSDHDGGCAVSGIASLVQTSEPKHQGKNHQATNKRTGAMPMPMPTSGDFHVPIPGLATIHHEWQWAVLHLFVPSGRKRLGKSFSVQVGSVLP